MRYARSVTPPANPEAPLIPSVYKPKPSLGWLSWLAVVAVTWFSSLPALVLSAREPVPGAIRALMWAVVALGVYFAVIAALYRTMRYELVDTELVLRYGPILTYRIPYESIRTVERRDLTWSLWSSMRLPGLALYRVPYARIGTVRMCSTRSAKGVLLIHTDEREPYGISPTEEDRFLAELRSRARNAHISA